MADQLNNAMNGMSLGESKHAPSGAPNGPPGPNGFHPERSAYIPPHLRNVQPRPPPPSMNGSVGPGAPSGPAGPAGPAGPGGPGAPGGPAGPGLGQSQWAAK